MLALNSIEWTTVAFALLAFALLAFAVTQTRTLSLSFESLLSAHKQYDYIVIGAGPGGSVIASRLSENPNKTVLLIEAGPSDSDVLNIRVPFLAYTLQPNTAYDWNYTTAPQKALNKRVTLYSRGRVLGGSSSINLMVYTRSSRDDFNKYAALSGDAGWSWDAIQPYFRKLENLVPPVDHHDTRGQIDAKIHGTNGPLAIALPNAPFSDDSHVIAVTQELEEFPFNQDMSSGNPIGIGWVVGTYGNGVRTSASSSYLEPVMSSRANLDVLVQTTATRLIQTGTEGGVPVFRGVEVAASNTSSRVVLVAKDEVILSAGTINTPQLLLLSGLGPSTQLSALGIPTIVDLPDVGQHLADHPRVGNQFGAARAEDDPADLISRNTTLFNALLAQWNDTRTGIMGNGGTNQVGWLRIPDEDPIWHKEKDPSAGPTSPHYEFLFRAGFASTAGEATPPAGFFMTIITALVSPSSRGTVTLTSTDPFTAPTIDPNLLSTPFDVYAIRSAVRAAARFASAHAWQGFLTGQAGPFAAVNLTSDASVDAWVRAQASSIWHPAGTARMGRCGDAGRVVDPDLRVRGVQGLRVVDASVLPFVPAAHPQAVVYAVAERAADLIKSGRSSC